MDKDIMDGIRLWLAARQLEAVHIDNQSLYKTIELLQADVQQAIEKNVYPWEVIMEGFSDRAEKFFQGPDGASQ